MFPGVCSQEMIVQFQMNSNRKQGGKWLEIRELSYSNDNSHERLKYRAHLPVYQLHNSYQACKYLIVQLMETPNLYCSQYSHEDDISLAPPYHKESSSLLTAIKFTLHVLAFNSFNSRLEHVNATVGLESNESCGVLAPPEPSLRHGCKC